MRPILVFGFALLSMTHEALAEGAFTTDAFGLFPTDEARDGRDAWAGLVEAVDPEKAEASLIAPGEVETVLFFLGPKSLVAGKDEAHAVTVVLDALGNLVPDGTGSDFTLGPKRVEETTRSGIADHLFRPDPVARIYHAGVGAGRRQSNRATYRVVSDIASVQPVVAPSAEAMRTEQFHQFASAPLADRFGNPVEDGIALQAILSHPGGMHGLASATVLDARAETTILTRDMPPAGSVHLALGAMSSGADPLRVDPVRQSGELEATAMPLADIDAVEITVGPFLTDMGHVLNDGAPVELTVISAQSVEAGYTGWLRDGMISAMFPISPRDFPIRLEVMSPLGTNTLALTAADLEDRTVEVAE
ncbi:MAG: hypothetical protein HUJ27_15875 [Rhodobacteraceae bacterium]|nr:hypothetical protein [Paracoccaceae bacterium]